MNKFMEVNKKIENAVVSGYKSIEDGVVSGYKKIEDGVVGGYKKIENKFVEAFLTPNDDPAQKEAGTDTNNQTPKRSEQDERNGR